MKSHTTPLSRLLMPFGIGLVFLLALVAPAAQAAVPVIESSSLAAATETSATLGGMLDPKGAQVKYHFDYVPLAEYELNGFTNAKAAPEADATIPGAVKGKADLLEGSNHLTNLSTSAGIFAPGQALTPITGIPAETTITEVIADSEGNPTELVISKAATVTSPQASLTATGAQPVAVALSPLSPATAYRARLVAKNLKAIPEEGIGPEFSFATFAPPPTYGPCPNDLLRSGELAPSGKPGARLPDCRSYEQASPVDKDGNNALGQVGFERAAIDGSAITFGTTFAIPGTEGAQVTPFSQATRGGSSWSTTGLQPPASLGDGARILEGTSPDLSATYAAVINAVAGTEALYELHADGSPPTQIAPFVPGGDFGQFYLYRGSSADGSTVVIQSPTVVPGALGAGAVGDAPNVYAWDRATGQLHLAGVMNTDAETASTLTKGAIGGPYNWAERKLSGFFERSYYLEEEHAVSTDGSVFFTSASNGHLYQRLHPTETQSAMEGDRCTEPAKACTVDLSATRKDNGDGSNGSDPVGAQPAAFLAASTDGASSYFTSSEKLTNDANTGPEVPPAQIGRAELTDPDPNATKVEDFLPAHALGLAVDSKGEYIYWADPSLGTIGRAKLKADGSGVEAKEPSFIEPGEGQCEYEFKPIGEPGVYTPTTIPSTPRYVAVDDDHIYWTNTGLIGELELPQDGGGTIGRADIDGAPESVEPDFICGEDPAQPGERFVSNPQGIAVNATDIYWANAAMVATVHRSIAGAAIDGSAVQETFLNPSGGTAPYGVALSATHLYYVKEEEGNQNGYLMRAPLAGGEQETRFIGKSGLRGLALDGAHVYWATQGEGAIGRADLDLENKENEFIKPEGTLEGLATSPDGKGLFYSTNGEAPTNPGNDLYRFRHSGASSCADPNGCLEDLTPDPVDNGAEVQGVIGASDDGSYLYFVANGDLDGSGPATRGDCQAPNRVIEVTGQCNLYRYHDGEATFLARLEPGIALDNTEAHAWSQTPQWPGTYTPKTGLVSPGGLTLLYRSRQQLTDYDNHGIAELYRFRVGDSDPICVSCNPSGQAPSYAPTLGSSRLPYEPNERGINVVAPRYLSSSGDRAFFETTEALVGADTNGEGGCPVVGSIISGQVFPRCLDVYEWEAPGTGSCTTGGPGYSPANAGCIYLISTGKGSGPSLFADASASGDDVFFISADQLVGQDSDELTDVYDARALGGLAAQNPSPQPSCEAEGCKPAATPPPPFTAPPAFSGPADPKPKHAKPKKCKGKHKGKGKKKGCKKRKHAKRSHRHHGGKK